MKTALAFAALAILAAAAFYVLRPPACPEWAARDVHSMYIDLADGELDSPPPMRPVEKMQAAAAQITDQECYHAYVSLAPDSIRKSKPELRALAASFLRRYGGPKYQP